MHPDTPSDPPKRLLRTDAGDISYSDEGPVDAPILAMVHGLPGSGRDFRWLAPVLNEKLRLIRIDLPSTAPSLAVDPSARTPTDRARFALSLIDALGIERFVPLGHSLGGPVAAAMTTLAKDRCPGMILLSPACLSPHKAFRLLAPHLFQKVFPVPGLGRVSKRAVRFAFSKAGFPKDLPLETVAEAVRIAAAMSFADYAQAIKSLREAGHPTFLAYAHDDGLIEKELFDTLSAEAPAGERLVFERGGHNIQKSHAIQVGEDILRFVHSLEAKA